MSFPYTPQTSTLSVDYCLGQQQQVQQQGSRSSSNRTGQLHPHTASGHRSHVHNGSNHSTSPPSVNRTNMVRSNTNNSAPKRNDNATSTAAAASATLSDRPVNNGRGGAPPSDTAVASNSLSCNIHSILQDLRKWNTRISSASPILTTTTARVANNNNPVFLGAEKREIAKALRRLYEQVRVSQAQQDLEHEDSSANSSKCHNSSNSTWNQTATSNASLFVEWILDFVEILRKQQQQRRRKQQQQQDSADLSILVLELSHIFRDALAILNQAMDQWDDCLMYSIVLQHPDDVKRKSLWQVLLEIQRHSRNDSIIHETATANSIRRISLQILIKSWNSMDRVQWLSILTENTERHVCDMFSDAARWCNGNLESTDGSAFSWNEALHFSFQLWTAHDSNDDCCGADDSGLCVNDGEDLSNGNVSIPLARLEDVQCAAAKLLLRFLVEENNLQESAADWIHVLSPVQFQQFVTRLLQQAQRLIDPSMPYTSFARLSLSSLALLSMLHWKMGGLAEFLDWITSTSIVQHVLTAALIGSMKNGMGFLNGNNQGLPRWVKNAGQDNDGWTLLCLLSIWKYSGILDLSNSFKPQSASERQLKSFIQEGWTNLLLLPQNQSKRDTPENDRDANTTALKNPKQFSSTLLRFVWLLRQGYTRNVVRTELIAVFKNINPATTTAALPLEGIPSPDISSGLLNVVLDLVRSTCESLTPFLKLSAASMLFTLLADGRRLVTHDALSRSFWEALDLRWVQKLFDTAKSLTGTTLHAPSLQQYQRRPALLCLLELLYMILSTSPTHTCQELLQSLSAESIESLINLMSPRQVRMDLDLADFRLLDSDDSTPPANNLSRLEDKSICLEQDEETACHGLDPVVRMTTATVLAILGNCSAEDCRTEERVILLQRRVNNAVSSFAIEFVFRPSHNGKYPLVAMAELTVTMAKLRVRLLRSIGTPENEDVLAVNLCTVEQSQRKALRELQIGICRTQQKLDESVQREKQLVIEKETLSRKLTAQNLMFQKEKVLYQQQVAQAARQLVEGHQAERSHAERRLDKVSINLAEAQSRAETAEQAARSCQESEAKAREEFERTSLRLQLVEGKEREATRKATELEELMRKVSEELKTTKETFAKTVRREKELRNHINEQEEALNVMENSHGAMRDSLENLFADMVSLAQLYEIKEQEEATARETGDAVAEKLKRKLEAERQRNNELITRYEQIQHDNEMLSKKYAKVKEKLDNERQERREEVERRKRTGPVSYINQLHHSTISDKNMSTSRDSSRRQEKENESSHSSRSSAFRSGSNSRLYK